MDTIDNATWSRHWSVPLELCPVVRAALQRGLFQAWNSPHTVKHTGRVLVLPDHLQRPGAAGMYLLERMGVDLTPLPEGIQELICSTSCQHRVELWPRVGDIPRLVYCDGRAMYMGCCKDLGIAGGQYARSSQEIEDHERGRAYVDVEIPRDWSHVGLLAAPHVSGAGWLWPAEPGQTFDTWADLSEIRFARQQGWRCRVQEKITWLSGRPLDMWADRLSRLYLAAKERRYDVLAGCYRAIALHTIGRLHNLGYRDQRSLVQAGDHRATFDSIEGIDADGIHIKERVRVDKPPTQVHPEWSAAIWSRVHLRLSKTLLAMPREAILAVRGDAIYSTAEIDTGDDGRPGRFRIKGAVPGPIPAPQTWEQLREVLNAAAV